MTGSALSRVRSNWPYPVGFVQDAPRHPAERDLPRAEPKPEAETPAEARRLPSLNIWTGDGKLMVMINGELVRFDAITGRAIGQMIVDAADDLIKAALTREADAP